MMKEGFFLINANRGGVVDEQALYDAMRSSHLAGADFEVLAVEPPKSRPKLFSL